MPVHDLMVMYIHAYRGARSNAIRQIGIITASLPQRCIYTSARHDQLLNDDYPL